VIGIFVSMNYKYAVAKRLFAGKNKCSASAEIRNRVDLHRKCLFTPRRPVVTRDDSFCGRGFKTSCNDISLRKKCN